MRMSWGRVLLVLLAVETSMALARDSNAVLLREPTICYCVFLEHSNVTCYWEPAANTSSNVSYILTVKTTPTLEDSPGRLVGWCNTTQTHCSVNINTVMHNYSMQVWGHSGDSVTSSCKRVAQDLTEVKLYPPVFTKLLGVAGRPTCLKLHWERPTSFGLSRQDMLRKSLLLFQIELRTPEQCVPQSPLWTSRSCEQVLVREQNVSAFTMEVCCLTPGTTFTVRLRYRLTFGRGPWSDWSSTLTNTTTEADSNALLLREPTIRYCVFLEHSNVTCYWEPAANTSSNVSYVLTVKIIPTLEDSPGRLVGWCNTTQTHCSVNINTVMHNYSMQVWGHSGDSVTSSCKHIVHGLTEVKLYPPVFTDLLGVAGRPTCLKLHWERPLSFVLSRQEMRRKTHLLFQIELCSPEQELVKEQNVSAFTMEVCGLPPWTKFMVRLRYRLSFGRGPWSDWSSTLTSTTTEAVPSVAPQVWRFVKSDLITLMWKPLSRRQANGQVVSYSVRCRQKEGGCLCVAGECDGSLPASRLSCQLPVPVQACSCSVSATNSVGTSPWAHVDIPTTTATAALAAASTTTGVPLGPLSSLQLTPRGEHHLGVRWATEGPVGGLRGFVVQWSSMTPPTPDRLHWERLDNASARELLITDGVEPEVPCYVSIQALLDGDVAGQELSSVNFTREGAPSVGPKLEVQEQGEASVTLQWDRLSLEQLRGFLLGYTIMSYNDNTQHRQGVAVGSKETQKTLRVFQGNYNICIEAMTTGGSTAGPCITVRIAGGSGAMLFLLKVLLPFSMAVFLLVTIKLKFRIQKTVSSKVPDPSKSSLSTWSPPLHWQQKPWILLRQEEHRDPLCELIWPSRSETGYSGLRTIHQSPLSTDFTYSRISQSPLSPDLMKLRSSQFTLSTELHCHTINQSPPCSDPNNHTVDQIPITTEMDYHPVQSEITVDFDYCTVHQSEDVHRHTVQPKLSDDTQHKIIDPSPETDYGYHRTTSYHIVQQYSIIHQSPGTEKTQSSVTG